MAAVKFAPIEVGDFLTKKQSSDHDLAADWAQLEELYNKKLWHQITLKLQELVTRDELQSADNLIQLYNNFLITFENKINPLSLVEIVAQIIKQYKEKKEAIAFLEKIEAKVKTNDQALIYCKVLQGQLYLEHLNDLDSTEKIITDIEVTLEDSDGVTPVHGYFYRLASEYYRLRGTLASYVRCALRYVGCEGGGENMPLSERRAFALRLALAAVLADSVYNLGELLAHPILECLEGTEDAWAAACVRAVAIGDLKAFEALRPYWGAIPDMVRAERPLKQKIAILCLMEMAFNRASNQRRLTFAEIANEAHIDKNEVELLVMKALAKKLVQGHIDQVSETVRITWVKPRALARAQVAALATRLDEWCTRVSSAAGLLERAAQDVLTL